MEIDRRLSDVLSEFARTLVTDFPIQSILDHLVVRIVDVLPVSGAGVTLISPGTDPQYIAASDESALGYERLQTELAEGPCLVSYHTDKAVSIPDLRKDTQFPAFSARAVDLGLRAVFTFPLRHGDQQLGALDLYRGTAGDLNTGTMAAAQTLADVAAAYLLNAQARTELLEATERARLSALHDALTGLPNRNLLVQRLDHAILRCRRSGTTLSILFVDLDRFKSVNDTYGHHIGDELLIGVAERLTALLRPGDTMARLAGDEFVVLCEDLDDPADVEPIAARIAVAFGGVFVLSTADVYVSASVGIAFSGPGENVPEDILRDADTAMYQAKRRGGANHGIVDLREQNLARHRASLNRDLPGALARGELRTEYQPIVATDDKRIVGVEALLRWSHPTLGVIPPTTLIPLAEHSGMITEIGRWVLDRACRDLQRWQHHNHALEVSVNVSVRQLMAPDFAATVAEVLAETGTDPRRVTLEVTESVFIHDSARALHVLTDLKHLGVMLALDDFGTGYSSLSYLKEFPVDIVKMDRSFIADLGRESASSLIVGAIAGLAHGLQMRVIAEGVESADQYAQVVKLDCDSCQGYFFARPAPADEIELVLSA